MLDCVWYELHAKGCLDLLELNTCMYGGTLTALRLKV